MKIVRPFAVGLVILTLAACGGGGSSPTGPATPAGPTQAQITVTCQAPSVSYSSRPGFTYTAIFTCTLTESAGLGAAVNYVRAQFTNNAGIEIERQEVSSADLIAQLGTNRLAPNTTFTGHFQFDLNAGSSTGGILTFNFTDDRMNVLSAPFTFNF